jgi:hypothetical protein
MQQMMASMGSIDPAMLASTQAAMGSMSPAQMQQMSAQMAAMSPDALAQQAQQASSMMAGQQTYVLNVSAGVMIHDGVWGGHQQESRGGGAGTHLPETLVVSSNVVACIAARAVCAGGAAGQQHVQD